MRSRKLKPRPKAEKTHFSFNAIGTLWTIEIGYALTSSQKSNLLEVILSRIEEFDKNYSRFRGDSLISRMAVQKGDYKLPADARPLLDLYRILYDLTGGLFTPLIGNVIEQMGYDSQYSLNAQEITQPATWDEALEYVFPQLIVKKPVTLDFGAAGKGYLVDLIAELFEKRDINSYCIDAGGDIRNKNMAITVGLEHPDTINQVIGTILLSNRSICGSATNRRKWGDFHHIVNPHTLKPVQNIKAVWVTAESTLLADALATALFFVSGELLLKHFTFNFLIINSDSKFRQSTGFGAEMYTA